MAVFESAPGSKKSTEFVKQQEKLEATIGKNLLDKTDVDDFYRGSLFDIETTINNLGIDLSPEDRNKLFATTREKLDLDISALQKGLEVLDEEKRLSYLAGQTRILLNAQYIKRELTRPTEEAEARTRYKEHSLEKIRLRKWKKSDAENFRAYVKANLTEAKLVQCIEENPLLWNPKGNPDLYRRQQCAEVAIVLLINYCYVNRIDLALPAGDSFEKMSNYATVEDYMSSVYPKLSASHFWGGGGFLAEIPLEEARPGDLLIMKHKGGGYHAEMLVSPVINNTTLAFTGNQYNKEYRSSEDTRWEVEEIFPKNYTKVQPGKTPQEIAMHAGGYGVRPYLRREEIQERYEKGDQIKFMRIDPRRI